jgi:hypothetical protein
MRILLLIDALYQPLDQMAEMIRVAGFVDFEYVVRQ